jgi:hypothetical protein
MPDRVLRAGILTSEGVNKLSWPSEVFYRRLMSVADDFGRYDGRPSILRAALYPLKLNNVSEPDVAKWLDECSRAALVRCYVVEGKQFIEILKFDQRLRASKSKWPSADKCPQSAVIRMQEKTTTKTPDSDSDSDSEYDSELKEGGQGETKPQAAAQAALDASILANLAQEVVKHGFCDEFENEIPLKLRTVEFVAALKEWHAYKRERREGYTEKGARALLRKLEKMGDPAYVIDCIHNSMGNNWAGLFDVGPSAPKAAPTNGAMVVIKGKEYERVVEQMKTIRATYGDHQIWSTGDVKRFNELKERRNQLKQELGLKA